LGGAREKAWPPRGCSASRELGSICVSPLPSGGLVQLNGLFLTAPQNERQAAADGHESRWRRFRNGGDAGGGNALEAGRDVAPNADVTIQSECAGGWIDREKLALAIDGSGKVNVASSGGDGQPIPGDEINP